MASPRTLARIETAVWVLIYGGLFLVVLGIASHGDAAIAGWSLGVVGSIAVVAGVVLIYVRSRLVAAPAGAQSNE